MCIYVRKEGILKDAKYYIRFYDAAKKIIKDKSFKIFLRLNVWKLYKKTIINNFCQFPDFDAIFDMKVKKGSDKLGQNRWKVHKVL